MPLLSSIFDRRLGPVYMKVGWPYLVLGLTVLVPRDKKTKDLSLALALPHVDINRAVLLRILKWTSIEVNASLISLYTDFYEHFSLIRLWTLSSIFTCYLFIWEYFWFYISLSCISIDHDDSHSLTSLWRHCDVIVTSLWRHCDVIVTSLWRHSVWRHTKSQKSY
jgi:hypothetical protein